MNSKLAHPLYILILIPLLLIACSDGGDEATATAQPTETEVVTEAPTETEIVETEVTATEVAEEETEEPTEVTPEATPEAEGDRPAPEATDETSAQATDEAEATQQASETEEPAATEEVIVIPNVSEDGTLNFSANDVVYNYTEATLPEAPENREWVLVQLSLRNVNVPTFMLEQDDFMALDEDGNRYAVEDWQSETLPMVVGSELSSEDPIRGFMLFSIPMEATITAVEWYIPNSDTPLVAEAISISGQ